MVRRHLPRELPSGKERAEPCPERQAAEEHGQEDCHALRPDCEEHRKDGSGRGHRDGRGATQGQVGSEQPSQEASQEAS